MLPAGASADVQARLVKGLLLLGNRVQVLLALAPTLTLALALALALALSLILAQP